MTVQPSTHLVLINGHTHQEPWYEGDSHLSYSYPYTLAECWKRHSTNEILDTVQDLWREYHQFGFFLNNCDLSQLITLHLLKTLISLESLTKMEVLNYLGFLKH